MLIVWNFPNASRAAQNALAGHMLGRLFESTGLDIVNFAKSNPIRLR